MSFTAFDIAYDGQDLRVGGGGRPFADKTRRLVRILPSRKEGQTVEIRPFGREGTPNATIPALHLRVEVVEGQQGAGRNLFATGNGIPLARQIFKAGSSTDKVPAYDFAGFFTALGYDVNDKANPIHIDEDFLRSLGGRVFEAVIGLEIDNSGELRNFIRFYNEGSEIYTGVDPVFKDPRQAVGGVAQGGAIAGGGFPGAAGGFAAGGFPGGAPAAAPGGSPGAAATPAQTGNPAWLAGVNGAPLATPAANAAALQEDALRQAQLQQAAYQQEQPF